MAKKINKIFELVQNTTISEDSKEIAFVWSSTIVAAVLFITTCAVFH